MLFSRNSPATLLAGLAAVRSVVADAKINVYWGQNGDTRLADVCADEATEFVTLAFVNQSPEKDAGSNYPGTDFGLHCPGSVHYAVGGSIPTNLISSCTEIIEDIPKCHAAGVKILLSIGGVFDEATSDYTVSTVANGEYFADFLWGAFGPYDPLWTGPRPFDANMSFTNYVDGFDFDVEKKFDDQTPWIAMIDRLRARYAISPGSYLITGAPQCPLSDQFFQMKDMIANAQFDLLFIQFYNNPSCAPISGDFNFDDWETFLSGTKSAHASLYIGLPAAAGAAGSGYLAPADLKTVLDEYASRSYFGGVMLWDSDFAAKNVNGGQDYVQVVRSILATATALTPTSSPTPSPVGTPPACGVVYTVKDDDYCYKIAEEQGTTVAKIKAYNPGLNAFCDLTPGSTICLPSPPPPCGKTYTVVGGDSCSKIAGDNGITLDDFLTLNPLLTADPCLIFIDQTVCVAALGSSPTATTSATSTSTTAPAATTSPCTAQHTVVSGDICFDIAMTAGITVDELTNVLNPGLNCGLLGIGQVLCVSNAPVTTTSTSSSSTSTPTPTALCTAQHTVVSGDICFDIAMTAGITVDELTNVLNPGLDCGKLFIGQVMCISNALVTTTSTSSSATSSSSTSTPTPTALCTAQHTVVSGDICFDIATTAGITVDELTNILNPGLDCGLLFIGQVLCVSNAVQPTVTSTSSSTTETSTSSTSTESSSTSSSTSESSTSSTESSTSTSATETSTSMTETSTSTSATETSTLTSATETSTSATETSTSATETSTSATETSTSTTETSTSATESSTSTSTESTTETSTSATETSSSSSSSSSSAEATTTASSSSSSSSTEVSSASPESTSSSSSTSTSTSSELPLVTSTVRTTLTYTITSCSSTVTDCPARIGGVTTVVIDLYTTICPAATETPAGPVHKPTTPAGPVPKPTDTPKGPVPKPTSLQGPVPKPTSLQGPVPKPTSLQGPVPKPTSLQGPVPKPSDSGKGALAKPTTTAEAEPVMMTLTVVPAAWTPVGKGNSAANGTSPKPTGAAGAETKPCPGCAKAAAPRGVQVAGSGAAAVVLGLMAVLLL